MGMTLTLMMAAIGLGSMHTLAPDHWVPFAALARAERWSAPRTALVTALCGLGHVTVSVALGLGTVWFGLEVLQIVGTRLEGLAGLLVIAFGVVYGAWGLHRAVGAGWHAHDSADVHWHAHRHGHHHRHADPHDHRLTPWTLFLIFCADPCVAVIPLMFASAPLGRVATLTVALAYEVATIGTMVVLVLPARAAAATVRGAWADRYGDALAGGLIAAVGVLVVSLGV